MILVTLFVITANLADAARRLDTEMEQLAQPHATMEEESHEVYSVGRGDFFPMTPINGFRPLHPTYPLHRISRVVSIPPVRSNPHDDTNNYLLGLESHREPKSASDVQFSPAPIETNTNQKDGSAAYTPAPIETNTNQKDGSAAYRLTKADDDPTFSIDSVDSDFSEGEVSSQGDGVDIQVPVARIRGLSPARQKKFPAYQAKQLPNKPSGMVKEQLVPDVQEEPEDRVEPEEPTAVAKPATVEEASSVGLPCGWMVKMGSSSKYVFVVKASLATGALASCKVCLHNLGYGEDVLFTPLLASSTGATTFLNGFVLAALIADFKESEKIVSDMTGCLENVYQTALLTNKKAPINIDKVREELNSLAEDIMLFLGKNNGTRDVFHDVFDRVHTIQDIVGPTNSGRVLQEASTLNKLLIRASHIKNVDFIPAAFAIVEVVTILFAFGTLVLRFEPFYSSLLAYSIVVFIFIYLNLFYAELDEAFGPYPDKKGQCDVSMFVLDQFKQRMNPQRKPDP